MHERAGAGPGAGGLSAPGRAAHGRGRHRRHHRLRKHRPAAGDRRAVPALWRLVARRCRLWRRPAGRAALPRLADRHRTRRLGHRGLPQVVLPAGQLQRLLRSPASTPELHHSPRRLPQPAQPDTRGHAEPGQQEHPDHPPLRRAEALADPAHPRCRASRRDVRGSHRPRRRHPSPARRRPGLRGLRPAPEHAGVPLRRRRRGGRAPGRDQPRDSQGHLPLRRGGHCRHRGQGSAVPQVHPAQPGNHAGRPARHRRADS